MMEKILIMILCTMLGMSIMIYIIANMPSDGIFRVLLRDKKHQLVDLKQNLDHIKRKQKNLKAEELDKKERLNKRQRTIENKISKLEKDVNKINNVLEADNET